MHGTMPPNLCQAIKFCCFQYEVDENMLLVNVDYINIGEATVEARKAVAHVLS
jgi:hypothetical protein